MATETPPPLTTSTTAIPDYIKAAHPNPLSNRAPWYKNTAPTYAGIFLWFVFWDQMPKNGLLQGGLAFALLGVVIGALICHFLFYLVPGLLGMKTGLPLYIVGSSTFGARGGLLIPGFLMGALQFCWLGVNTYASALFLARAITSYSGNTPLQDAGFRTVFYIVCVLWAAAAALTGLKGIQYVAKVATYLPLIPLLILIMGVISIGTMAPNYTPPTPAGADTLPDEVAVPVMNREVTIQSGWAIPAGDALLGMAAMVTAIVGFFATAGAAGVDFGMNSRNESDVQSGGVVGILLAILITAGAAVLIVAGAHEYKLLTGDTPGDFTVTNALKMIWAETHFKWVMVGLTLASFPGACFSSFIAANSFKTVMPRINSLVSVGIGTLVSVLLAVSGVAGDLVSIFLVIGASFGPICGAMVADYYLAGKTWSGPRAGFNCAGWIAWLLGFFVGILPNLNQWKPEIFPNMAAAPVAAFFTGLAVYYVLARIGWRSHLLPFNPATAHPPGSAAAGHATL